MDSSLPKFILDPKKRKKIFVCVRERQTGRQTDRLRRTETDRHIERQRQKRRKN